MDHGTIVTVYCGFALPAILARHAAAGPQHIDTMLGRTLGADAANKPFTAHEGPRFIARATATVSFPNWFVFRYPGRFHLNTCPVLPDLKGYPVNRKSSIISTEPSVPWQDFVWISRELEID